VGKISRKITVVFLLCLMLPLAGVTGIGQEESKKSGQQPPPAKPPAKEPQDQDEPITLSSRLVLVPLSVTTPLANRSRI
jgi:hypothetical protein